MDTIVSPNPVVKSPEQAPGLLRKAMKPLRIGLIFLVFLMILAVAIAAIFEKQIGNKLIGLLNNSLETELVIEDFDLSLLRSFPKASAQLQGVILKDLTGNNLLEAETVSFNLGIMSLFSGQTKIPSVQIAEGTVLVAFDKSGKGNYNIFKASDDGQAKEFSIDLEQAIFEEVTVLYKDLRGPHEVKIDIEEGTISGKLTGKEFNLDIEGDLHSNYINLDGHKYLVNTPASILANMHIDIKKKKYTFTKAKLNIEENPLVIAGSIQNSSSATTNFDLQVLAKNGDVATLISFLPKQYTRYIADFKSSGNFDLVGKIKGPLSKTSNPAVDLLFGIENGKIRSQRLGQTINKVNFKGKFSNGTENRNKTSLLQVKNFKGTFRGEPLAFDLSIKNLDRPYLKMSLDGKLATADIVELINNPKLKNGKGVVRVKEVGISGNIKDLMNPERMTRAVAKGRAEFKGISFSLNDEKVAISDGRFLLSGNKMSVSKIDILTTDSDLSLSGNCYNLIPVMMADSSHANKIRLRFNGNLISKHLDLDAMTAMFSSEEKAVETNESIATKQNRFITAFLQGTFSAKVDKFHYDKIQGTDFAGALEIANNEIKVEGKAKGMGGDWVLDGKIFLADEIYSESKLSCEGINIKEFFRQTNNFGQEVLRSEHISGVLLTNLKIDAFWDKAGNFDMDKLVVLGDVAVADGGLDNFEMLYSFSKYINSEDLRHVRFTTMRNWLEVKNRKINIPSMFIQSNALNLELCGVHTFENKIDYNFKINAGQVLVNKFKKQDSQFVREQRDGLINLHYRVYGSIENYRVKSDPKYVKRKLSNTMAKKNRIQKTLRSEFGTLNIPEEKWQSSPPYFDELPATEIITEKVEKLPKEVEHSLPDNITGEGLGPSADNHKPDFRLEELLNKKKKKAKVPAWEQGPPAEEEEEFLDFEIEGGSEGTKKKSGGKRNK